MKTFSPGVVCADKMVIHLLKMFTCICPKTELLV